jgi:hypothetical protein
MLSKPAWIRPHIRKTEERTLEIFVVLKSKSESLTKYSSKQVEPLQLPGMFVRQVTHLSMQVSGSSKKVESRVQLIR